METEVQEAGIEARVKRWGREVGFDAIAIAGTDLAADEERLLEWLGRGWHGEMDYMARHGARRARPAELVPGTVSVITARLNYTSAAARDSWETIEDPESAFISRYALGRDCGLGWRGKHTLLLSRDAGSLFFLGELFVSLDLAKDASVTEHCGTCARCIDICPTKAIVAPYQLDARRCISYLTIEHHGAIPEELRPLMGNRIYGCDDCQLVCPWNKYAKDSDDPDFAVRNGLDSAALVDLFSWTEEEFNRRFEGSAIRRIGHERWLRNIAVALGNAPASGRSVAALESRRDHPSALVREHVSWALARHAR